MIGETVSHYRILEKLGEGGMGVVYRAQDTKLEREVALKFLPADLVKDSEAKRRFINEARTASALDHPNICTIYEIDETEDGRLFLAMAYYEGESVGDLISAGPMEPEGALSIAQQITQGLVKAHERGIVHRDIKPGNMLITQDGLVKVVDFGLAMLTGQTRITQAGAVLGTVAYMSPEQIQGNKVDHRTDLWSLGVVLYEMMTGRVPFLGDYQQAVVYSIINNDPAPIVELGVDVPEELQGVIKTCLAKAPEERYQTAQDLLNDLQTIGSILMPSVAKGAASLVDVTARMAGRPYPGLASFTEAEAGFFYGREAEIESLWQELQQQPLLGVIGPSGTGKTSFLRAGVIPVRPEGWSIIICTPGSSPFLSLRQALVPELAGDTDAIRDLLGDDQVDATLSAFTRWQKLHDEALLILDQFEELFTLNPPEVQSNFTELIGRITEEAGIRVMLSLRDDFLFFCHGHPALRTIFKSLTPLGPLTGDDLRRALKEPAQQCGYRFEEDTLVDEIITEVEGERGALPLLAFAMSKLWEKRDRGRHLLTRQAYEEIGGVSGALALHAEATMERIGAERQGIVRELFRNLVTSRTTRIARKRNELLSLFEEIERDDADAILGELTRARLLNSYEDPQEEGEGVRRVEIVHESLLTNWPRLVRWQTQDMDSAQLRDEVRQAAEAWDARGRLDDLLWTGTLYQEINLWKERYPGALTSKEEEFYSAIQDKARQKRRKRITAVASSFVVLIGILIVIFTLWRQRTVEATQSAANLLASLGQQSAETCPTKAVAYAIASLELIDNRNVRCLALENLAKGPLYFSLPGYGFRNDISVDISPDGRYYALGCTRRAEIWLHHSDSDNAVQFKGHEAAFGAMTHMVKFDMQSKRLLTAGDSFVCVWSVPDGELLHEFKCPGSSYGFWTPDPDRILTATQETGHPVLWQSWSLLDGTSQVLGRERIASAGVEFKPGEVCFHPIALPDGKWAIDYYRNNVYLFSLKDLEEEPILVGTHEHEVVWINVGSGGTLVASIDIEGCLRIWDLSTSPPSLNREFRCPADFYAIAFDHESRRVATYWYDPTFRIFDLKALREFQPIELSGQSHWTHAVDFHDDGQWLISAANASRPAAWPLTGSYPHVITDSLLVFKPRFKFLPDGKGMIAVTITQSTTDIWLSPHLGAGEELSRKLFSFDYQIAEISLALNPDGQHLAVGIQNIDKPVTIISIEDQSIQYLDVPQGSAINKVQFSHDGRLIGASLLQGYGNEGSSIPMKIWDLETGNIREIGEQVWEFAFTTDGGLLTWSLHESLNNWKVESWDLEDGSSKLLKQLSCFDPVPSPSGRYAFFRNEKSLNLLEHASGEIRHLFDVRSLVSAIEFNLDESLLAIGLWGGEILLFSLTDDSLPHLLLGGDGTLVGIIAFDPTGQYLFSSISREGTEGMFRRWPIPKGRPLLDLSHAEILEYLRSQTNVRVVPDPEAEKGFRITKEPFKGWDALPMK